MFASNVPCGKCFKASFNVTLPLVKTESPHHDVIAPRLY